MTVPYMEDPGAGVAMYESDDIINYSLTSTARAPTRCPSRSRAHTR